MSEFVSWININRGCRFILDFEKKTVALKRSATACDLPQWRQLLSCHGQRLNKLHFSSFVKSKSATAMTKSSMIFKSNL